MLGWGTVKRSTATVSADRNKEKKKKKKSRQNSTEKKFFTATKEKNDEKERINNRNKKAKQAGARLGGFIRSSLSLSRPRSKLRLRTTSLIKTNIETKSSNDNDHKISESSSQNSSTKQYDDGDIDFDQSRRSLLSSLSRNSAHALGSSGETMNLSFCSFASSTKSEKSLGSLTIGDIGNDWPIEAVQTFQRSLTETKTHSDARERLVLESQTAIARKQTQAKIKSLSLPVTVTERVSNSSSAIPDFHQSHSGEKSPRNQLQMSLSDHSPSSTLRYDSRLVTEKTPKRHNRSVWDSKVAKKISTATISQSQSSRGFSSSNRIMECLPWHNAIQRHDWESVERLLRSYDHSLYRKRQTKSIALENYRETTLGTDHSASPLLDIDVNNQTPLHLACKEHMPLQMLLRLLFVERRAAGMRDKAGRLPLHTALINHLDNRVVDRLIRAFPGSLSTPDDLFQTPIQYGILKAEYLRDKTVECNWSLPTTKSHHFWQRRQEDAWKNVLLVLESMISRRKALSLDYEQTILLDSVKCCAPPSVVKCLLTVGSIVMLEDGEMSRNVLVEVLRRQYPKFIIDQTLKVVSKVVPERVVLSIVRQSVSDHFNHDTNEPCFYCSVSTRESFTTEILRVYSEGNDARDESLTAACKEWWEKLCFLITHASDCLEDYHCDDFLLHAAVSNPSSPVRLIGFLCHLFPSAKFKAHPLEGTLPSQLSCMEWYPTRNRNESEYIRVVESPRTDIAPSHSFKNTNNTQQVYQVQNLNIVDGFPKEKMSPLTFHVLRWCYDRTNGKWYLNLKRTNFLRQAIRRGRISKPLEPWWSVLQSLVWRASNDLVNVHGHNPMCDTPQTGKFLLHAALWNNNQIPPIVIELILEVYPSSVSLKQPGTGLYPLQIAAQSPSYQRLFFKKTISMSSALEMLSIVDSGGLSIPSESGRIPLHEAIWSGKALRKDHFYELSS